MKGKTTLIAMKGHPGTGKSTLAKAIASTLKIPLIDKDDVRNSTLSLQTLHSVTAGILNDLSYQVIWQIASTQLHLGLSLILDSPLSRRSHFEQLLYMASMANAQLIIVECKPSDEAEWRRRLEHRGNSDHASWHKPSTWQEMETLVAGYGGCTEYNFGDIPKLVVDTTANVRIEELVLKAVEFIKAHTHND